MIFVDSNINAEELILFWRIRNHEDNCLVIMQDDEPCVLINYIHNQEVLVDETRVGNA